MTELVTKRAKVLAPKFVCVKWRNVCYTVDAQCGAFQNGMRVKAKSVNRVELFGGFDTELYKPVSLWSKIAS